jgi:hypothetical protein
MGNNRNKKRSYQTLPSKNSDKVQRDIMERYKRGASTIDKEELSRPRQL